ncbi:hypothetical protein NVP2275O_183 [Vibrio phage 2.275.O._10N.286.54.E11]|nr:hypothetical protein NVP2275O_183 [Vibrio phage 2.275.O._10N.286.54.E11]
MDELEIYFVNDEFKCIYGPTCRFPKKSWEKIQFNDTFYYIAPSYSYEAAIEQLQWRALDYKNGANQTEEFKQMIIHATNAIIDMDRGDGFTLMLMEFGDWCEALSNYSIPEEYK